MNIRLSATAVAVAAALPFVSNAVAATEKTGETVVVTATRIETRVADVLSDVSIVEREDIERSGGATLPEMLGTLPGIQVTRSGGRGSTGTISIHGSNSNHVLILVDGQRVSSATFGTTAIEHIPLEQIERIEVLRGAASGLYGSDAVGGVIQIFTRASSGTAAPSLSLGAGRYGTVTASAGYGAQLGATRFNVMLAGEHSDGFGSIKESNGGFFDPFNSDRDPYENHSLSASVSHDVSNDLEVGAKLLRIDTKKDFDATNCDPFFSVCTAEFDNRMRSQLRSLAGHARYQFMPGWLSTLKVGQSEDNTFSWLFDPVAVTSSRERFDTRQDQYAWENEFNVPGGKLLGSAEWRKEDVKSTQNFVETERTTRSLVLGYQGWFGDHSIQASGRVDEISRLGTQRNGAFAYGYRFAKGWLARASVATAFHAPTFNDLYWPFDPVNFFVGNPDLKPERSRSREIGVSYEQPGVSAGLTLFYKNVSDLINFVSGGPPTFIGTMENVSDATLKGATFHYSAYSGPWAVKVGYDVLSAKNDETGRTLQRRAPRTGSVEVRRDFTGFDLGAQLTATSRRYNNSTNTQTLGGYALVNVDANVQLDKNWSIQGRINNLFDRDYVQDRTTFAPASDYVTPGRFFFMTLRYAPK